MWFVKFETDDWILEDEQRSGWPWIMVLYCITEESRIIINFGLTKRVDFIKN